MTDRWLQKKSGDPFLYNWTEALAAREDMREVRGPGSAPVAASADDLDEGDELDRMTVAELRDYAEENGVDLGGITKKADIRDAIRAAADRAEPDPLEG